MRNNTFTIMRMAVDPALLRFLLAVHRLYRRDPHYSFARLLRSFFLMAAGEKVLRVDGRYLLSSFLPPLPSRAFMSMLTAVPSPQDPYTQQMRAQRTAPISFYVSLTDRCRYRCLHCSAQGRAQGAELTTDEWIAVLCDLQAMGTAIIGFTGGEPLLRDDLEQLVAAVDDRSVTYLFTNGEGLTRERALALRGAGLFGVGVSLDAVDSRRHDAIRRHDGAHAGALQAMANARDAGLHVMAQRVVFKEALDEEGLLQYFRFAGERGAQEVRVLEPICSGSLLQSAEDGFFTDEERRRLIRLQETANRQPGLPKITVFAHTESPERYGCGAGTQHSYLTASGDLYPCDFLPLRFGNVRERKISELWREMNRAAGLPKGACFAMTLHSLLRERGEALPIPPEEAAALCRDHQATEYPGYYRTLQGKSH